ncbi:hypothetical protein [Nonomuraea ceibae]|uniref:hypothetical protein n=1 Tax=Nonomuraea ceibae TaxID=1935170 RepID=UPI001C60449C|nr:hypothetical protein [Nonomuraea ceibae]
MADIEWEIYRRPETEPIRIADTSCCGAYEFASQGGQYLVLRRRPGGGYEEAGRGLHRQAQAVWDLLVTEHSGSHRRSPDEINAAAVYRGGADRAPASVQEAAQHQELNRQTRPGPAPEAAP